MLLVQMPVLAGIVKHDYLYKGLLLGKLLMDPNRLPDPVKEGFGVVCVKVPLQEVLALAVITQREIIIMINDQLFDIDFLAVFGNDALRGVVIDDVVEDLVEGLHGAFLDEVIGGF